MSGAAEFTPSPFGGGWIVPKDEDTSAELSYYFDEGPATLLAIGPDVLGWIVEPADVEGVVLHLRDAGYQVELS